MSKFTKQRSDSWAAALEVEDQWKVYAKFRRWSWDRVAAWAGQRIRHRSPQPLSPLPLARFHALRSPLAASKTP